MTTLQREVSRKLSDIGFTSKYDENQKHLVIQKDGCDICFLRDKGSFFPPLDVDLSEEQSDAFQDVQNLIERTKEYIIAYENAKPFDIEGISDYRKLAEFNGVIFGAKDCGDYGFQFSSWYKTYGGKGAMIGRYSFNYDTSKQIFAERSGLVDMYRQFTDEQLENLHRCLAFTKDTYDDLSYDQNKAIGDLIDKLENVLPYLKDNPEYQFTPSDDGTITFN